MRDSVIVTGVGMVTAVGLSAAQTCAALRGGIARFAESTKLVDRFGEPVIAANPPGVGQDPVTRSVDLTMRACRQALAGLASEHVDQGHLDIYMLHSDSLEQPDAAPIKNAICTLLPHTTEVSFAQVPLGNAAGIAAVQEATDRLSEDPRRVEVILGYDNLTAESTLARLDRDHRLKTSSCPRGVIPGEAAACVVLESSAFAIERSRDAYASIMAAATAQEEFPIGSNLPCLGIGLTTAIDACLKGAGWESEMVGGVYCDLNGEEYRAHEWMLALTRNALSARPTHPADSIGDIGASFSPLLIGSASVALRRGYAGTDKVLIFCSSEHGLRGAICLSPAG